MELVVICISLTFIFFLIVFASTIFINAIEYPGEKLNLFESAVGSVIAATETALPERVEDRTK